MDDLTKVNHFSFLSFIIIGLSVYATFNLYQSLSVEEDDSSQLNNNQESNNDFFSSLSRTLPNIDEDPPDENEKLDNEGVIFDNFNTEEPINEEGGGGSSSKKTESNEQEIRDSLTESLNNRFSNGNQETEIINEKGSSEDIEQSSSNEDNDNKDNENIDDNNIETR
jgi:hypothetical protein